jgi:hypothetical protein
MKFLDMFYLTSLPILGVVLKMSMGVLIKIVNNLDENFNSKWGKATIDYVVPTFMFLIAFNNLGFDTLIYIPATLFNTICSIAIGMLEIRI